MALLPEVTLKFRMEMGNGEWVKRQQPDQSADNSHSMQPGNPARGGVLQLLYKLCNCVIFIDTCSQVTIYRKLITYSY